MEAPPPSSIDSPKRDGPMEDNITLSAETLLQSFEQASTPPGLSQTPLRASSLTSHVEGDMMEMVEVTGLSGHVEGASETGKEIFTKSPISIEPIVIELHDTAIDCACPIGTKCGRKDLVLTGVQSGKPVWTHLPCSVLASRIIATPRQKTDSDLASVNPGHISPSVQLTKMFSSSEPTAEQLFKIKNFTSMFHCDGPCKGSKDMKDYFLCKKCCAWQHKPCILYGDRGDVGGPVCNRCYMSFLLHGDEIRQWQRQRLLQAVQEAWNYLHSRGNHREVWRREWCIKFLARFFHHNQGVFIKFVAARRPRVPGDADEPTAGSNDCPGGDKEVKDKETQPGNSLIIEIRQDMDDKDEVRPRRRSTRGKAVRNSLAEQNLANANSFTRDNDEMIVTMTENQGKDKDVETRDIKTEFSALSSPSKSLPSYPKSEKSSKRKRSPSPLPSPPRPRKLRQTPARPSNASRKSAPSTGVKRSRTRRMSPDEDTSLCLYDNDTDDDDDVYADGNSTSKYHLQAPRWKDLKGPDQRTSCKCTDVMPVAVKCFECDDCNLRQHIPCAEDTSMLVCNYCFYTSQQERRKSAGRPPSVNSAFRKKTLGTRKSTVTQQIKEQGNDEDPNKDGVKNMEAIRSDIVSLGTGVLWQTYASLAGTVNLSLLPPTNWLIETQSRLLTLITTLGPQPINKFMGPALSKFPRQNNRIMRALRDMVVEEMFSGSLRAKRQSLGILLEILELEKLGTVWKPDGASDKES